MSTTDEAQVIDEMLDIPAEHRAVAQRYGRGMYALVINCGLATVGLTILMQAAEKHQSNKSAKAIRIVSEAFNSISRELSAKAGWTAEMLHACEQDLHAAASPLVKPQSGILLPH